MKVRAYIFLLCMILPSGVLSAQKVIEESPSYSFESRFSAEIDKKIFHGAHLSLSEEIRMPGDAYTVSRSYTELGVSYKVSPYMRFAASYDLIAREHQDTGSKCYRIRHRGQFDVIGKYDAGAWRFSLRERIRATYNPADINLYQSPHTLYALCSRIKAEYMNPAWSWTPYTSVEIKNTLNNSRLKDGKYHYNDVYINRVRLALGAEWRLDKKNYLDFYTYWDFRYDKDLDATRKGRLKSITIREEYRLSLGIAYKFAL